LPFKLFKNKRERPTVAQYPLQLLTKTDENAAQTKKALSLSDKAFKSRGEVNNDWRHY